MEYTGWCQNDFNVQGYSPRTTPPFPRALPPPLFALHGESLAGRGTGRVGATPPAAAAAGSTHTRRGSARCATRSWGDNSHSAKGPGGQNQGSQKGFQWVILGLERVQEVRKGVRRGPVGPPGPPELAALTILCRGPSCAGVHLSARAPFPPAAIPSRARAVLIASLPACSPAG